MDVVRGKGAKPRRAFWANGRRHSPTREVLRRWIQDGEGRPVGHDPGPDDPLWPSKASAFNHWVVHRLGPASGLQRRIETLNGSNVPRYLVHPHLARACHVIYLRRFPRTFGAPPTPWETIAANLGHESSDMTRTRYWYADEEERLDEMAVSIPIERVRTPARAAVTWRWRRT